MSDVVGVELVQKVKNRWPFTAIYIAVVVPLILGLHIIDLVKG